MENGKLKKIKKVMIDLNGTDRYNLTKYNVYDLVFGKRGYSKEFAKSGDDDRNVPSPPFH